MIASGNEKREAGDQGQEGAFCSLFTVWIFFFLSRVLVLLKNIKNMKS